MKNALRITAVALCCVALVACSQKGPAEAALKAAEASVNEIKAEGAKYAPEQTKGVLTSFASAQDAFNRGDYKVAMEIAQGIPAKAKDVVAAVAAEKDALTKSWNELNASVPGLVEQVKAKVDAWSAMKKLPKDVDAAKVEASKAGLAEIQKSWGEASDAFKTGNLIDANAKGNAVKTKVTAEMVTIGIAPVAPPAAPAAAAAPAPAPPPAKPATK
jgi:predicted small lipoprotein YifL